MNKKTSTFLLSTKNTLPKNIQEQVAKRMKYINLVNDMLARGGQYKNLMYHGFFNPQNYENRKNAARRGNKLAKSMVNKYNASRNKIISFMMDDSVKMTLAEKKNLVKNMLTNRKWDMNKMIFVKDLRLVKKKEDLNTITKMRKNTKNKHALYMNFNKLKL